MPRPLESALLHQRLLRATVDARIPRCTSAGASLTLPSTATLTSEPTQIAKKNGNLLQLLSKENCLKQWYFQGLTITLFRLLEALEAAKGMANSEPLQNLLSASQHDTAHISPRDVEPPPKKKACAHVKCRSTWRFEPAVAMCPS